MEISIAKRKQAKNIPCISSVFTVKGLIHPSQGVLEKFTLDNELGDGLDEEPKDPSNETTLQYLDCKRKSQGEPCFPN